METSNDVVNSYELRSPEFSQSPTASRADIFAKPKRKYTKKNAKIPEITITDEKSKSSLNSSKTPKTTKKLQKSPNTEQSTYINTGSPKSPRKNSTIFH